MRTFVRVMAMLLVVAVVIGIGAGVYNAGVTAGLAESAQQVVASGDPAPAPYGYGYGYGPYWHGPFGLGVFGIIFWILGIFLIIGLVRAAFGGGGRWGGRGPSGPGGPGGWGDRRDRVEELHRELHRRDAGTERAAGA